MSCANEKMSVNGHHHTNGLPHHTVQAPHSNGAVTNRQTPAERSSSLKPPEKGANFANGVSHKPSQPTPSTSESFSISMLKLPDEILEMLAMLPDDVYVPMGTLVRRATYDCWSHLVETLEKLSGEMQVPDLTQVTKVMPSDQSVRNDTSKENRLKKEELWGFAQRCRHVLTKLHILMQWASKREENKLTIALNLYIHKLRGAYSDANSSLVTWINYLATRQDAAPDLDTALQILATGRVDNLPDLGYLQQKDLSATQMLSTLKHMNSLLQIRMAAEQEIPLPLRDWNIHDGRISFTVPQEFDLDLSIMSEDVDAVFQFVDVRFKFSPSPSVSEALLNEITGIVNLQLIEKGLHGAYNFLHELVLTQKLKELHNQALRLRAGLWAGHLQVELLKRTLIVQYWTRRPSGKSWIEITLDSGRAGGLATPFINLRWKRHGKLVTDHEIEIDLTLLSFENILNQVVAQHANFLFEGIYDRLVATPLFKNNDLDIEQVSSLDDAFECHLSIELSKRDKIRVACDSVSGAIILSPVSDRVSRFQHDLSRSSNIVDDFVKRFSALRCGLTQAQLLESIHNTSWISLPGRRPAPEEIRDMFAQPALRAAFFKQPDWPVTWSLAATFGLNGDAWWVVYEHDGQMPVTIKLHVKAIHLQPSLSFRYFEKLSEAAETTISVQVAQQAAEKGGMKTILPQMQSMSSSMLRIQLDTQQNLSSFGEEILLSPRSSKKASLRNTMVVVTKLKAPKRLLERLAAAGLDSSIVINPEMGVLRLNMQCTVGQNTIDTILARLRYVHDLLSCIKLVHSSGKLKMQKLTLQSIGIDYETRPSTNLGVDLLFHSTQGQSRIRLLPAQGNPHSLVSGHLDQLIADNSLPLSDRLEKLLATLSMTLPLMNSLQYLQGQVNAEEVPQMKSIDLEESRKWLRVHVMVRDISRFGVHIFAVNPAFEKDVDGSETPQNLLGRFEILPHVSRNGSRIAWLIRPAIEEFSTYHRPSFTNKELRQRLKERIFSSDTNKPWISLDSGATCLMSNPYGLIVALHGTILEWVKEALASKPEATTATNKPQAKPVATPQMRPNSTNQHLQQRQQQLQQQQQHQQRQFQGRPLNVPVNVPMNAQMQMHMNNGNMGQGTSRVMTAPPQQIRQPQNHGQRRPGQGHQNRNPNQPRAVPGPQHDVINLD